MVQTKMTNISIRVDEDLRKDVEALFSEMGLTLSVATNVFFVKL